MKTENIKLKYNGIVHGGVLLGQICCLFGLVQTCLDELMEKDKMEAHDIQARR